MASGMIRRTKFKPEGLTYPAHWDVSPTWKHGRTLLESRLFDFQVKGERGWFTFNRHVLNTKTGSEWLDGFAQHPYGGFVSFAVDRITRVRKHVEPRKPGNATPNDR